MAVSITLPKEISNIIRLADWMELNALVDDDKSSSIEDLISSLKIASSSDDVCDRIRADVAAELLLRNQKNPVAYPFSFNGKLLRMKQRRSLKKQWPYLFCLLISYIGLEKGEKILGIWDKRKYGKLFEELSTVAARNFLTCKLSDASALNFGAPRTSWLLATQPFRQALEHVKSLTSEGDIIGNPTAHRRKDAGLDVVAWREFPDKRSNKMLLLGQCAAGGDFRKKRYELQDVLNYISLRVNPIRAFFIPHEVDETDWHYYYNAQVGTLFDRSRVAFYAQDWESKDFIGRFPTILKRIKRNGSIL